MTKLDRSGSALAYSSFLGGTGVDVGNGIAVDEKGSAAYLTGSTDSGDYPITARAHDSSDNGGGDAFVTELSTSDSDEHGEGGYEPGDDEDDDQDHDHD